MRATLGATLTLGTRTGRILLRRVHAPREGPRRLSQGGESRRQPYRSLLSAQEEPDAGRRVSGAGVGQRWHVRRRPPGEARSCAGACGSADSVSFVLQVPKRVASRAAVSLLLISRVRSYLYQHDHAMLLQQSSTPIARFWCSDIKYGWRERVIDTGEPGAARGEKRGSSAGGGYMEAGRCTVCSQ
jgi:hypothetical protein